MAEKTLFFLFIQMMGYSTWIYAFFENIGTDFFGNIKSFLLFALAFLYGLQRLHSKQLDNAKKNLTLIEKDEH